jgi:hypothetical protein
MKTLIKKKSAEQCCATAQCCAKISSIVAGCHD